MINDKVRQALEEVRDWIERTIPVGTNGATFNAIKLQNAIELLSTSKEEPASSQHDASDKQIIRLAVAAMPHTNPMVADDLLSGHTMHTEANDIVAIWRAAQSAICPFCKEADFDLIGLRMHLNNNWCPKF
jgi:hypothetical protein